jgi:hypothetical protein
MCPSHRMLDTVFPQVSGSELADDERPAVINRAKPFCDQQRQNVAHVLWRLVLFQGQHLAHGICNQRLTVGPIKTGLRLVISRRITLMISTGMIFLWGA